MHDRVFKYFGLMLIAGAMLSCAPKSEEPANEFAAETPAVTAAETAELRECIVLPPDEPLACTMQYDPVCGCNGKTYSNACTATARGVPWSTPGACNGARND